VIANAGIWAAFASIAICLIGSAPSDSEYAECVRKWMNVTPALPESSAMSGM
jgi:hypothetical protein